MAVMRVVAAVVLLAAAGPAFAVPVPDDPPAADAANEPAEAKAEQAKPEEAKKEIPLADRLPPGFKVKKRGKYTLYCKTETPLGTRFKKETCYDEDNMRAYMLAMQENKADVDRIRNICSNPCACGQPQAC